MTQEEFKSLQVGDLIKLGSIYKVTRREVKTHRSGDEVKVWTGNTYFSSFSSSTVENLSLED